MKCQYGGCKNNADFIIIQTVGKKQKLNVCRSCAPAWVKAGKEKYGCYKMERIEK